jgi:hypothetical protein
MNEAEYVQLCKLIGNAEDLGRRPVRGIVGTLDEGEGFTIEEPGGCHYALPLVQIEGLVHPILISDSPVIPESKPKVTMEIGDANKPDFFPIMKIKKGDTVDWNPITKELKVNGEVVDWQQMIFDSKTKDEENPFDGLDPTWDPHPDA